MKKILTITTALLILTTLAQAEHPYKKHHTNPHGGFGGFGMKFTNVGNDQQILFGGSGAGFLSDNFYWGGGGYGTVSNSNTIDIQDGAVTRKTTLDMGYGGFMVGYVKPLNQYIKWETQLLLGFGGFTLTDNNFQSDQNFFVAEPSVNFYVSPTEWLHIGLGAGYRFANLSNGFVDNSIFNKPSFNLNFNFGNM